jgi:hypothetical protein
MIGPAGRSLSVHEVHLRYSISYSHAVMHDDGFVASKRQRTVPVAKLLKEQGARKSLLI